MHFSLQALFFALVLIFFIHNAYADLIQAENTNKVAILSPHVQPPTIKVGDALSINATIVNNSLIPIYWYGKCEEGIFSVTFDNHITVSHGESIACPMNVVELSLNPSQKITATSPTIAFVYRATSAGTANATVTYSYFVKNQTNPKSEIWNTISKSFLFTIYDNNIGIKTINETVLSPLKQFKSGIALKDIVCRYNLQLVVKKGGLPVCVKSQTAQKLIERGWGITNNQVAVSKAWVKIWSGQCHTDPWIDDWNKSHNTFPKWSSQKELFEIIKSYYEKHGITIFGVNQSANWQNTENCGAGGYYYLQVSSANVNKMINLGFTISNYTTSSPKIIEYGTLSGNATIQGGLACGSPRYPCNNPGANYEVDVYANDGVTIVGKTFTDNNTNYSILLPVGNYIIYTYGFDKQAHSVSIVANQNTIFNIAYDSGIR